jgi:hypothetical protein
LRRITEANQDAILERKDDKPKISGLPHMANLDSDFATIASLTKK